MATELHDRLSDLAAHTPPASPPGDLWDRGTRRRRVVVAGRAAMVLVLVLLVGLGGWGWHTNRTVQPADTHGSPHLPDRFYVPSPWLHAFEGAPGQLVAIGGADRKHLFHTSQGVYGVTASAGQYGFLDLPHLAYRSDHANSEPPVLSPDGHHVAYWTTGPTSGSPNTTAFGRTIAGVAVYDTETGGVRSASLATEHGLAGLSLAWSDADTLVMSVGQVEGGDDSELESGSYTGGSLVVWSLEDQRPHALEVPKGIDRSLSELSAGKGFVVTAGVSEARGWLVWPRSPARDRRVTGIAGQSLAVVSPNATRVANVRGSRNPNHLYVGTIEPVGGRVHVAPVNGVREYYRPITWTDDRHVVALVRNPFREDAPLSARLDLVDVRTGSSHTLVDGLPGAGNAWDSLSFANALLTAPRAPGHAPPHPWDQRWVAGGVLAFLLVAGLYLWGATRGRRA
jgi:hypothetical protein